MSLRDRRLPRFLWAGALFLVGGIGPQCLLKMFRRESKLACIHQHKAHAVQCVGVMWCRAQRLGKCMFGIFAIVAAMKNPAKQNRQLRHPRRGPDTGFYHRDCLVIAAQRMQ